MAAIAYRPHARNDSISSPAPIPSHSAARTPRHNPAARATAPTARSAPPGRPARMARGTPLAAISTAERAVGLGGVRAGASPEASAGLVTELDVRGDRSALALPGDHALGEPLEPLVHRLAIHRATALVDIPLEVPPAQDDRPAHEVLDEPDVELAPVHEHADALHRAKPVADAVDDVRPASGE